MSERVWENISDDIEKIINTINSNIEWNKNSSLYLQGINSLEMVQIIVAIEDKYNISMDSLLTKLNIVCIEDICEVVYKQISLKKK